MMDLEDMTFGNTLLPYLTATSSQQTTATKSSGMGFDLVVSPDVLVYFGALDDVLRIFREVSVPGALLVFSCERTTLKEAPLQGIGFCLVDVCSQPTACGKGGTQGWLSVAHRRGDGTPQGNG
jgi:hypothetical protein